MKKLIALLACLTVCMSVFAVTIGDNPDDPFEREFFEDNKTSTQIIIPEDQHCTDKNASVRIEYMPIVTEPDETIFFVVLSDKTTSIPSASKKPYQNGKKLW